VPERSAQPITRGKPRDQANRDGDHRRGAKRRHGRSATDSRRSSSTARRFVFALRRPARLRRDSLPSVPRFAGPGRPLGFAAHTPSESPLEVCLLAVMKVAVSASTRSVEPRRQQTEVAERSLQNEVTPDDEAVLERRYRPTSPWQVCRFDRCRPAIRTALLATIVHRRDALVPYAAIRVRVDARTDDPQRRAGVERARLQIRRQVAFVVRITSSCRP